MINHLEMRFIKIFFVVLVILGIVIPSYIYGNDNYTTVVVGRDGSSSAGPIFDERNEQTGGYWYPGRTATSTLRVRNQHGSPVTLDSIGMGIALSKEDRKLELNSSEGNEYLSKMKIKIQYKDPLRQLREGVIYEGTFGGLKERVPCRLELNNNDTLDLVYTVAMDESAGNALMNVRGDVDFIVGVKGEDQGGDGSSSSSDTEGHWAHDCIQTLLTHGIIERYKDGSIRPDKHITRAETAELVVRALKLQPKNGLLSGFFTGYKDKLPDNARGYILAATEKGIFLGRPGGVFAPEDPILREEITAVFIRSFKKESKEEAALSFTDKEKIEAWAVEYVNAAVRSKVVEGRPDNTFAPKDYMTRAEAFTIVCKLLGYHPQH